MSRSAGDEARSGADGSEDGSEVHGPGGSAALEGNRRGLRGRGSRRDRLVGGVAIAATVVVVGLVLLVAVQPDGSAQRSPARASGLANSGSGAGGIRQAEVSINRSVALISVPRSFLGLSTEYWTLPIWERRIPLLARVLALIHVPGDGPLAVRIGGDSADHTYWETSKTEAPEWAFELTPAWVSQATMFVRRADVHLLLDLNLVTATPAIAVQWAQAAQARLPRGSVGGFEIGNEPDIYSKADWLKLLAGIGSAAKLLPSTISATSYAEAFGDYALALSQIRPRLPLLAPALANPSANLNWISALLATRPAGLSAITAHRYPYSACAQPGSGYFATIARMLSENATAGMAQTLRGALGLARRAGLPLKLTELNSVTCGGRPGVSNTFATALWAPDALFELLRAGVNAASIHVREYAINSAFVFNKNGLTANPLFYGMIAFSKMLGRDAKLVALGLHANSSLHLKAWAVSVRGNLLHVLVIDKGAHPAKVLLSLPGQGTANVQRLQAPTVSSHSRVTLAGQRLNSSGRWSAAATIESLSPSAQGYQLTIARQSAALITVHLRPGAAL
jgi:hypothetical protein